MLTVVTGAPCSGKSTHVAEQAQPGDVVVDLDAIAHALGYPDTQVRWGDTHPAIGAARMARAHVIHALLNGRLRANAWIIDTRPTSAMRAQYERARAEVITIDPGMDVCLERAAARHTGTSDAVREWYADQRPSQPSSTSRAAALGLFD